MAKKTKKRKSPTGKRRMSGVKDLDLQKAGLAIAGAVAANKITAMMSKKTGFMEQAAPYAGLVLGVVLPMFIKNQIVKDISVGLVAGGGITAIKKLAPTFIAGPYQIPVVSGARRRINGGVNNPNAVGNGGYSPARNSVNDTLSVIAGMPNSMNGSAHG